MKRDLDKQFEEAIEGLLRKKEVSIPLLLGGFGYLIYRNWERIVEQLPLAATGALIQSAAVWLVWVAIIAVNLAAIRKWAQFNWNKKNFVYLQILPHVDDEVKPETLGDMVRRIHGAKRGPVKRFLYGKEWMSFVIHHRKSEEKGEQYVFYIGAPKDRINSVKHHFRSLYAKAEFYPADNLEFPHRRAVGGRLDMKRKRDQSTLSLARYKTDQLPAILSVMEPGTWLQLAFSGDSEYRLKQRILKEEKLVKGDKNYRERNAFDREKEKSFKTRFYGNEVSFHVTVSVVSTAYRGWSVVRDTVDAIAAIMSDVNELKYRRLPGSVSRYPLAFPFRMVWTGSEMAKLFHLPDLKGSGIAERVAEKIPHGSKGTQRLPDDVLSSPEGFNFGELVHPLIEGRQVKIDPKALGKQWGLTGKTGSGKSTILNQILKSMIEYSLANKNGPGFSFIDPKKETATIVLNNLMKMELDGATVDWSKVKWISFKGAANPPAMNLLYRMPGVPDNVLLDQIMRIIRESNPNQAMQAERLLKKCIQTLLADKERTHTILGIKPLLLNPNFNRSVLARLKPDPANQDIVDFWEYEAEDLVRVSGQAILNRIDIFYSNDFMRRIFGQADFNFPIREWMDKGYMVFYDFSGMGEEEIALIGGYLSYLYYRIADTRPDRSLLHQFVIDEAQRVKASILPEIHAEMRSKGLSLGISTQTMEKLEPGLQKSLVNIVANMFVCGQGLTGAKLAAETFRAPGPDGKDVTLFSEGYLRTLPERVCVIKTEDRGKTVYAVVKVPPLDRYLENGQLAPFNDPAAIQKSNAWTYRKAKDLEQTNGRPEAEIDQAISDYLNGDVKEPAPLIERKEIELVPPKEAPPLLSKEFSLLGKKEVTE